MSKYIFDTYAELSEGELTKIRANVVCEATLATLAREIDLGSHILMGRGEEQTGGRNRASILSDAFEALLAAIYLDGGLECARMWLIGKIEGKIHQASCGELYKDFKTALQEKIQKVANNSLEYVLVGESGPDHDKQFTIELKLNGRVVGTGVGRSKKEAEQTAAQNAIEDL